MWTLVSLFFLVLLLFAYASYYSMLPFNCLKFNKVYSNFSYSFAYWFFSLWVNLFPTSNVFLLTKQNTHTKKSLCECEKLMQNTRTHGHAWLLKQVSVGAKQCIKISATMSTHTLTHKNHPKNRKRLFSLAWFLLSFFFAFKKQFTSLNWIWFTFIWHIFGRHSWLVSVVVTPNEKGKHGLFEFNNCSRPFSVTWLAFVMKEKRKHLHTNRITKWRRQRIHLTSFYSVFMSESYASFRVKALQTKLRHFKWKIIITIIIIGTWNAIEKMYNFMRYEKASERSKSNESLTNKTQ